jgi:hypothetical protein
VIAARPIKNTHVAAYAAALRGVHQSQKRGVVVDGKKVMAMVDMPMSTVSPFAVLVVGAGMGISMVRIVVSIAFVGSIMVKVVVVRVSPGVVARCVVVRWRHNKDGCVQGGVTWRH